MNCASENKAAAHIGSQGNPASCPRIRLKINFELKTMSFIKELWLFLRVRKKLWLAPIIIVMLILGGLLIMAQGSVVAPFVYTIF